MKAPLTSKKISNAEGVSVLELLIVVCNRDIYGSIMIARFAATGNFLEPRFEYLGGGGSSNLQYNSTAVLDALVIPGVTVLGMAEK